MKIVWTDNARISLSAIFEHITSGHAPAALRVLESIGARVNQLAKFPSSGRTGRVAGTREFIIAGLPYIAVYTLTNDQVAIVTIRHIRNTGPQPSTNPSPQDETPKFAALTPSRPSEARKDP